MSNEFEPFVKRPEVAFPSTFRSIGEPEQQIHRWGMELRDYFAAKAMQLFINREEWQSTVNGVSEEVAFNAYAMADAMMKARKR